LQVKGEQLWVTTAGQDALVPVQFADSVSVPDAQLCARHCVVLGRNPSGGHVLLVPSQLSAASQTPVAGLHTDVLFASAGQAPLTPSQLSAGSHTPAEGRQTAVLFASEGHVVELPVQVSAGSHTPVEARQVAPALPAGCWQSALVPLH
jgi:hypothetical protein